MFSRVVRSQLMPKRFFSNEHPKLSDMELIKLKNGAEVPQSIVITSMMKIKLLWNTNPIAAFELVEKCRNPEHILFGATEKEITRLGLMSSGLVHNTVKEVVLSAVSGDDSDMTLGSPLEEFNSSSRMTQE